VAAELRTRGMTPVADNKGAFESFWVKDLDGWDLQICNSKGLSARQAVNRRTVCVCPFRTDGVENGLVRSFLVPRTRLQAQRLFLCQPSGLGVRL
jgi:hypothetical protein